MLQKDFYRANEVRDFLSNHLGDRRPPGGILIKRPKDVAFRFRSLMDAKVFRIVNVCSAMRVDHFPERQMSNVLHGSED